jgi:hypothetical protein
VDLVDDQIQEMVPPAQDKQNGQDGAARGDGDSLDMREGNALYQGNELLS